MKTETFDIKSSWGYLIHDVAKLLKRRMEDEAKDHGITLPQWRTLAQISLGNDSRQTTLAAAIDADPMTMSGILDRLEKRGLITRIPDPTDSRAKLAAVTPEGQAVVDNARDVGRGVLASAMNGLSVEDQATLKTLLTKVRDNLQGETARIKELQ